MYKTILFDVDGVLLSEERYFDASALTVYELLTSPRFLGIALNNLPPYRSRLSDEEIEQIRQTVFVGDTVLNSMKSRGINANWDMVYLQFTVQFLRAAEAAAASEDLSAFKRVPVWTAEKLQEFGELVQKTEWRPVFADFLTVFADTETKQDLWSVLEGWYQSIFGEEQEIESTLRSIWEVGQQSFQEWYLGKTYLPLQPEDKPGFVVNEVPVVPPEQVSRLFALCVNQGISIGIATGRPTIETKVPFESYGWLQYFDSTRITTASDVLDAETAYPSYRPLSKPHPYCYMRSYMESPDVLKVLQAQIPVSEQAKSDLLIVGDSKADMLAAKAIGCDFAAVLTGLSGAAARSEFEADGGCRFIWSDVSELLSLLDQQGEH